MGANVHERTPPDMGSDTQDDRHFNLIEKHGKRVYIMLYRKYGAAGHGEVKFGILHSQTPPQLKLFPPHRKS